MTAIERRLAAPAVFLALIALWALSTGLGAVPPEFLPGPLAVLDSLVDLFLRRSFTYDVGASIYRVMGGYLAAAALAIPLGLAIGASRRFAGLVEPVVGFFRYLPVPSLVPLSILWIGIDNIQKIFVIFLGTFFQLTVMVADATRTVPTPYRELALTLGLNRRQRLARVLWPAALPGIFDALRICMGWAWSYLVVAELVAASSGIGHVVIESQRYLRTADVFAAIVVIGLIGIVFDQVFLALKGVFFPWTREKG